MSTARIQLQAGEWLAALQTIQTHGEDASPLMKDILLLMIRSTQLTFEAQGRPAHWADLADSTVYRRAMKALKGKGAAKLGSLGLLSSIQILRDTGLLMQSVGAGASGPFEAADGFGEADDFTAAIGTNQPGWQNQFPDTRGWREAREFLKIQDQDEDDMSRMGMDWMIGRGAYANA